MDILQLYQDYSVNHLTEGHKHTRPGWVNTPCPFCTGTPGYHLGYNIDANYFFCWRCGWHPLKQTLAKLLNVDIDAVRGIIKPYGLIIPHFTKEPIVKINKKPYLMPSNTGPLQKNHKAYLESRSFDPKLLERTWNLVGTGPVSLLDGLDYKLRIIIPVLWDSQAVTFTSRDVTNKSMLRYRACPKDREILHHKHILYGRQDKWKATGILVEGPTDVWRLGTNSFAVFGIQTTPQQVRLISKTFKRIFVLYDNDPQAVLQAHKIVAELRFRGVEAIFYESIISPDPGSMKQKDADYLVKQLIH